MRQVRFKFRCNILFSGKIIKEMPGSVASGTSCSTAIHLHFHCVCMTYEEIFVLFVEGVLLN